MNLKRAPGWVVAGVGVVVAALVSIPWASRGSRPALILVFAGIVTIVSGTVGLMIHRRERIARVTAIEQVREMVHQMANQHLAVLLVAANPSTANSEAEVNRLNAIRDSAFAIRMLHDSISEDQLNFWLSRHRGA